MKADKNGTWTERVRARMGWMAPAQVRLTGSKRACANCKYHWLKESPPRDGVASGNYSSYCGHPHAAGELGHVTRQNACCDCWMLSPK
ncbi:MAG: hypothetical protein ABTQ26_08820 [Azonexus sp.]